ncbi:hypothetical protein ACFLYD_01535 [Chloroflexota bacterium]
MESSPGGRCGEIASDLSIILVTVAQLVLFTLSWPNNAIRLGIR